MEKKKCRIILMTHGKVGQELIRGLDMIVGITDEIYAPPLLPGQTVEGYLSQVSGFLKGQSTPSILLVDLFGGTPSNCAGALSKEYDVEIISGVNIPMLIEAVQSRGLYTGEPLRKRLIEAGCGGIINLSSEMKTHKEK